MNHFVISGSIALALWLIPYGIRRGRASQGMLIALPCMMAALMAWSVAPDIPRLLSVFDQRFYRLYLDLAMDPRCNIFFWHYTLDATETDSVWYTVGLVTLLTAPLLVAWRELLAREREAFK